MPYITQDARDELLIEEGLPDGPGELNFLVTNLCVEYLQNNGENYGTLNEIVGVLECAKLEFYRRIASPYEDEKIKLNGDVYPE